MGFGVWGLGFGVWGLGFGVWGFMFCGLHLVALLHHVCIDAVAGGDDVKDRRRELEVNLWRWLR